MFVSWQHKNSFFELSVNDQIPIKDTKVCGEAGSQPQSRMPPLREGRHAKLFQAALALRTQNGGMCPGDGFIVMDGGREGILVGSLTSVTVD